VVQTELANKKWREATFFLGHLRKRSDMAFVDREQIDFYLSAFLSAARSIEDKLQIENLNLYQEFFKHWKQTQTSKALELLKFMVNDRNLEVHDKGSRRNAKEKGVALYDHYEDQSGQAFVYAPADISGPPATISKPAFTFTIDGAEEEITSACQGYLDLLQQLIKDFSLTDPTLYSQPAVRKSRHLKFHLLGSAPITYKGMEIHEVEVHYYSSRQDRREYAVLPPARDSLMGHFATLAQAQRHIDILTTGSSS
jgi:hypothetical protein